MSSDDQTNYFKKFNSTTWIDSVNQSEFFNSFETWFSFFEINSFWLNSLSFFFFSKFVFFVRTLFFSSRRNIFYEKQTSEQSYSLISWQTWNLSKLYFKIWKKTRKNVSKKKSKKSKNITTSDADLSFIKLNKIFRFLFDELKSVIFIEKKYIRLSIFSSVSSKTQLSFFFFRVSIKIFHDETFSIFFKNKTAKKRIDKLMFLNSRLNNDFFQSILFEEFDEMIVSKFVLFQKNYHTNALKAIIHKNMLHDYEKTKKQHFAERIATIEIWIKERRSWKIETCMTVYEIHRYDLNWIVFHIKMIQFFREWTMNDSIRNHEVHRSLSTWNMTEFDADLDVETKIESIKIIFVFAFIFAFKKSVTSKKKFVKTNLNVDDVIIIMINQSWFWIFSCAITFFV